MSTTLDLSFSDRSNRKRACVNCRRAHAFCDRKRPCGRCVSRNLGPCTDPVIKKRGPKRKIGSPWVDSVEHFQGFNIISLSPNSSSISGQINNYSEKQNNNKTSEKNQRREKISSYVTKKRSNKSKPSSLLTSNQKTSQQTNEMEKIDENRSLSKKEPKTEIQSPYQKPPISVNSEYEHHHHYRHNLMFSDISQPIIKKLGLCTEDEDEDNVDEKIQNSENTELMLNNNQGFHFRWNEPSPLYYKQNNSLSSSSSLSSSTTSSVSIPSFGSFINIKPSEKNLSSSSPNSSTDECKEKTRHFVYYNNGYNFNNESVNNYFKSLQSSNNRYIVNEHYDKALKSSKLRQVPTIITHLREDVSHPEVHVQHSQLNILNSPVFDVSGSSQQSQHQHDQYEQISPNFKSSKTMCKRRKRHYRISNNTTLLPSSPLGSRNNIFYTKIGYVFQDRAPYITGFSGHIVDAWKLEQPITKPMTWFDLIPPGYKDVCRQKTREVYQMFSQYPRDSDNGLWVIFGRGLGTSRTGEIFEYWHKCYIMFEQDDQDKNLIKSARSIVYFT
eukprot:gb/GECH01006431.1/.p1 GENE.gb/GECH01006431.1/~~gb/GECH01006431.1/.p1  ORF type:complete len:555 (+),score=126.44 gb/GECH01006431.1/:1-1665(+)